MFFACLGYCGGATWKQRCICLFKLEFCLGEWRYLTSRGLAAPEGRCLSTPVMVLSLPLTNDLRHFLLLSIRSNSRYIWYSSGWDRISVPQKGDFINIKRNNLKRRKPLSLYFYTFFFSVVNLLIITRWQANTLRRVEEGRRNWI